MDLNLGGMQFRPGRPILLPPPPADLPAQPIRLECAGRPQVDVGQIVSKGQQLAALPTSESSSTLGCVSSVDGTVSHIDARVPRHGDWFDITIQPNGERMSATLDIAPPDHRTVESWLTTRQMMCPWAVRDGNVGLFAQIAAVPIRTPDTLICIGLDHYPPYPVRSSLLMSFPDDVVLGTQIIADVVGAKQVMMLASKNPRVLSLIKPSCRNFQLQLITSENVYPYADPTLVVRAHTHDHRRLSVGVNPVANAGVVLISPWTAIRVARWFTRRRFDLARPMMVGWTRAKTSMTPIYALAGQPLSSLNSKLAQALNGGETVIQGNPMADRPVERLLTTEGKALDPVVPQGELLLTVLETVQRPHPEQCISCGWCVEICPTALRPNRMYELLEDRRPSEFVKTQLAWCIECGLCSHVCPSSIPLAQTFYCHRSVTDR